MLLQCGCAGTIPPPDFTPPNWVSLSRIWDAAPKPHCLTVTLGPATVSLGHDDFEADDSDPVKSLQVDGHEFGWDNESPQRFAHVDKFNIEWRPVTNGQFYDFYISGGQEKVKFPASWVKCQGKTCVCLKFLLGAVLKS
jgi:formylglycine-generating enzyme required for sulfatase activity